MHTVLLSAKALLAFGSGNEVRVAYGLVDEELLPFGLRDPLGWGAGQGGAFALLYQAGNNTCSFQIALWLSRSSLST